MTRASTTSADGDRSDTTKAAASGQEVESTPPTPRRKASKKKSAASAGAKKVRYAVVGLGHIAQAAILPGFANAQGNSELAALVSDDPEKLETLGDTYGVKALYNYSQYERCLRSGKIDAVFIATPNSEHLPFARAAARAGVHVLCEKPLGVVESECAGIIRACEDAGVKLMTAYRLHFEAANLRAAELCRSGDLGEVRLFNSVFTMQVTDPDNIRLRVETGGGPLHDIGIYCINAARMMFRSEPTEVVAWSANSGDDRFEEVPESVSAMMRFGDGQLATFVCSFGAADAAAYEVIGTKGKVRLDPAYEYASGLKYTTTIDGVTTEHELESKDQFGAEIVYFSNCVLKNRDPEPSGKEGLADIRIIRAMQWSMRTGQKASLPPTPDGDDEKPSIKQRITRPKSKRVPLVNARAATDE